ncbi:uncharacterized protein [Gossypium hirsutum]|uniref:CCHC-type domain-containing protein n=1 Tax=Gossypium hirsutum TaxID=3635 RepID=A0A1U8NJ42_GOSHI|nr:uncharacterized protein LOC107947903 [Gossypium hirsutum]
MRVLDELSCTLGKSLKCSILLLKDTMYHWWKTVSSVAPRESFTLEFFQSEFRKKYINQRFLDQKQKEFLELKQGTRIVSEYERKFVRLSQYVSEWVQSETEMCKHFEKGLNKEIKLLIEILEIRELATLADRAKKAKELNNERKRAKREARALSKRSRSRTHSIPTKKSKSQQERSTASVGYSGKTRSSKQHNPKSSSPKATSVGSVDDQKSRCKSYNKFHFGECRMKSGACFRCGSLNHFLRDCPEQADKEVDLALKSNVLNPRGRPPPHPGSASGSRTTAKDMTAKSEAQAPTRTYAICAKEEASTSDVITGSTYSYICMKLVSSMNMLVESTEFVIKVSNPLGKSVLVDKVLNCGSKYMELKCSDGDILQVDSNEFNALSAIESLSIVYEYPDVFLEELPGLPPVREVEFGIKLVPGTMPISITP